MEFNKTHKLEFDNEADYNAYKSLLNAAQGNEQHSNVHSIKKIIEYVKTLNLSFKSMRTQLDEKTAQIKSLNVELSKIDAKYQSTIKSQNERIMQLAEEVQKAQTIEFEHSADSPAESADEPNYSATDKKQGANGQNDGATDKEPSTFDEFVFSSKNILVFVSVLLVVVFMSIGYVLRSEPTKIEKPTAKVENTVQVKSKLPSSQHIENKFKRILNNK